MLFLVSQNLSASAYNTYQQFSELLRSFSLKSPSVGSSLCLQTFFFADSNSKRSDTNVFHSTYMFSLYVCDGVEKYHLGLLKK
jgi:hypothetical protein